MFIDVHAHARKKPGPLRWDDTSFCNAEQLIARYDELGVERGVVMPCVSPEADVQPQSTEEVMDLADTCDRFIPFCNVDPRAITNTPTAPLGDLMRYYKEKGCKGIGEVTANLPVMDSMVQNMFAHAQDVGLPMTLHIAPRIGGCYGLYDDAGLPQLEESLKRFPHLKIFGHSQPFWAEIAVLENPDDRGGYPAGPVKKEGVMPRLMRTYPNLCGDLSANSCYNALSRDETYAAVFLDEFQDKLMFGTDICGPLTPTPLADFLIALRESGKITEAIFSKIARENAIRILELAPA